LTRNGDGDRRVRAVVGDRHHSRDDVVGASTHRRPDGLASVATVTKPSTTTTSVGTEPADVVACAPPTNTSRTRSESSPPRLVERGDERDDC
jgi:hypothetical protein